MIKRFFIGIKEQAHLLGGIYYAWALVSTLAGGAYSGYKLIATPAIEGTSELLFYAFVILVVLAMVLVPLLAMSIFTKVSGPKHVVANPTLEIKSRTVTYRIKRLGLIKSQTLLLTASAATDGFRLSVALTGNGKSTVVPRSQGIVLLGPIARGGSDSYELHFSSPMTKGESRTIEFDVEVDDPNGTMRPFLTDHFHNAASYGSFKATYWFETVPASVFSDRLSTAGVSLDNMKSLIPLRVDGGASYEVSVPKIDDPLQLYSLLGLVVHWSTATFPWG